MADERTSSCSREKLSDTASAEVGQIKAPEMAGKARELSELEFDRADVVIKLFGND
jgi:hypothetical protein